MAKCDLCGNKVPAGDPQAFMDHYDKKHVKAEINRAARQAKAKEKAKKGK